MLKMLKRERYAIFLTCGKAGKEEERERERKEKNKRMNRDMDNY